MQLNHPRALPPRSLVLGVLATLLCLANPPVCAEPPPSFETRYRTRYLAAQSTWTAAPTNVTHAWQFARTTFDLAEFSTNDTHRARLAEEGIQAARTALDHDPGCAPAHYYLALNLGQLARTRLLGALKLVTEMERHFKRSAELDPHLDHGGPDRNLGILYREAPGWPASIGSRSKARKHLEKAVQLHPDFPANQLELLQAHLDWKERRHAEQVLPRVRACMAAVEIEFAGQQWEWARDGWQQFWEELQMRWNRLAK